MNQYGLKIFGRLWLLQYLGPIYLGIIAHASNPGISGLFSGYGFEFKQVVEGDLDQFADNIAKVLSRVKTIAKQNQGVCTFWLGLITPAVYITCSQQRLNFFDDRYLGPIVQIQKGALGLFFAGEDIDSKAYKLGRKIFNSVFMNLDTKVENIIKYTKDFINSVPLNKPMSLQTFCRSMSLYVSGKTIFQLLTTTLADLQHQNPEHDQVIKEYLHVLFKFSINGKKTDKMDAFFKAALEITTTVLRANFDSIFAADKENIIHQMFRRHGLKFPDTLDEFDRIEDDPANDILFRTIFAAMLGAYDTTTIMLDWAIRHIEANLQLKTKVVADANSEQVNGKNWTTAFGLIQNVILETVRLYPAVPFIVQTVKHSYTVTIDKHSAGKTVVLCPGTVLFADLAECNLKGFPQPKVFDPNNIKLGMSSLGLPTRLGTTNNELSTFHGGGGTRSRKCLGRIYSTVSGVYALASIYSSRRVVLKIPSAIEDLLVREDSLYKSSPKDNASITFTQRI